MKGVSGLGVTDEGFGFIGNEVRGQGFEFQVAHRKPRTLNPTSLTLNPKP